VPGHPFYGTAEWKAVRLACLRRQQWRCAHCATSIAARGSSRVDHIKTRAERPDLALEPTNLQGLCIKCDAIRHADKGGSHQAASAPKCDANGWPTDPKHHWNKT